MVTCNYNYFMWGVWVTRVTFSDEIQDGLLRFAVIVTRYQNRWMVCRHKARTTYEFPGGHREPGEAIDDTARRELFEESGAVTYAIRPVCMYTVEREKGEESSGMLYFAEITELGPMPESEIAGVAFFSEIPDNWTYPDIQPHLMDEIKKRIRP